MTQAAPLDCSQQHICCACLKCACTAQVQKLSAEQTRFTNRCFKSTWLGNLQFITKCCTALLLLQTGYLMFLEGVRRGYLYFSRKYFPDDFQVGSKACMSKVGPGISWDHLSRGYGCTARGWPVLDIKIIQTCSVFPGWVLVGFLARWVFLVCWFFFNL